MLIGHKRIQKVIEKALSVKKPAQAYLFSGPEHVGKFSLAMELAEKLTQRQKINQDFLWLVDIEDNDEEKFIDIKTLRQAIKNLGRAVPHNQFQVLVINQAEQMTPEAQNAFLKTLEENHTGNVVILITHRENRILPTIASRCQKLRFGLVAEKEMLLLLNKYQKLSEDEKKFIVFWSAGRPGVAKYLAEDDQARKAYHQKLLEIRELMKASVAQRLDWAEKIAKDRKESLQSLELWAMFFREASLGKRLGIKMEKRRALEILETILSVDNLARETNANLRLLLEQIVLKLS